VFFGEFEHTLDDKNRVSLPIRHREDLGETVMIGRGTRGQVNVLPVSVWKEMVDRAQQASQDRGDIDDTVRFLFSYNEAELDRQGRMVIPAYLRRHAELFDDVVILGNGDRIEIWSGEKWQARANKVVVARLARETGDDPEKLRILALNL
jgi:transcriptional regulator MraZ